MARNFNELREAMLAKMTPEKRAAHEAETAAFVERVQREMAAAIAERHRRLVAAVRDRRRALGR